MSLIESTGSQSSQTQIPVVLIHTGASDYLEASIRILSGLWPKAVYLIGDESNAELAKRYAISHVRLDDLRDIEWEEHKLGYVHDSYLSSAFEKFCFVRFNLLSALMNRLQLQKAMYIDSDILILNPSLMSTIADRARRHEVTCLSSMSTFLSVWSLQALDRFVAFFPQYFRGEAGGDRHCDMFALKMFLEAHADISRDDRIVENMPAYQPSFFGNDPNFSFSPLIMKITNVWDYQRLATIRVNISEHVVRNNEGNFCIKITKDSSPVRLDFVHLNGYNKKYVGDFERLMEGNSAS